MYGIIYNEEQGVGSYSLLIEKDLRLQKGDY